MLITYDARDIGIASVARVVILARRQVCSLRVQERIDSFLLIRRTAEINAESTTSSDSAASQRTASNLSDLVALEWLAELDLVADRVDVSHVLRATDSGDVRAAARELGSEDAASVGVGSQRVATDTVITGREQERQATSAVLNQFDVNSVHIVHSQCGLFVGVASAVNEWHDFGVGQLSEPLQEGFLALVQIAVAQEPRGNVAGDTHQIL